MYIQKHKGGESINILGKKNKSHWSVDSKAKKENNINITINSKDYTDLIKRYKRLDREVKNINREIKEISDKVTKLTNQK